MLIFRSPSMAMTNDFIRTKQWLFDRWAPTYDWLFPSVIYQGIHKRLLEYVQLPEQPDVLDLGCGTGRLLDRLAEQFPTLRGTGFDLSAEMIHQARNYNRHHPRLIYLQGNATALPFSDQQFDAVFNTLSFLHYPQPEQVFSEVSRVLKPGGRFYLVDLTARWQRIPRIGGLAANQIRLYSPIARQQLGREVGLSCTGHYDLLGPVLLTIFTSDI